MAATQVLSLTATDPQVATEAEIEHLIKDTLQKKGSVGRANWEKGVFGPDPEGLKILPENARKRFEKYGVDISKGYPERPPLDQVPVYLDQAYAIRNEDYPYDDRGKYADPEKKALLSAATEVIDVTKHIGTELVGVQYADLNEKQLDELALLVAERVVVFFRDQELSPQRQLEIGKYYGQVEVHPQTTQVPGLPGITVVWNDYRKASGFDLNFKNNNRFARWHTDLVHEHQPAGITSLHNDTIPATGGDTAWASGYAAYDKLSPAFQEWLDGKEAVFFSAHSYVDRNDPFGGPKRVERVHKLVRTHPVTGWKSLFLNRSMTKSIVGLEPKESDTVLEFLFKLFEDNLDIQVRFNWKPTKEGLGTTAVWDNRISQHSIIYDHLGEEPRHGTRVTTLGEIPFFDPKSKSQRQALGLSLD